VGKITAGAIKALQVTTDRLIAKRISSSQVEADKIVSPLVEAEQIKTTRINTETINLKSQNSNVKITAQNSKLQVENQGKKALEIDKKGNTTHFGNIMVKDQNNQTVAKIDTAGNAEFKGNVSIGQLQSNEVKAGTVSTQRLKTTQINTDKIEIRENLRAKEASFSAIYADQIIGKEGSLSDVLGQKIAAVRKELEKLINTNKANYDQGVEKKEAEKIETATGTSLASQAKDWPTEATGSAKLASLSNDNDLGNLSSLSSLVIQGQLTVEEAFVNQNLIVGNLAIGQNAISSLDNVLYLQPSGIGKVDILAGLLVVEDNGSVSINGDLAVNGSVTAKEFKGKDGNIALNLQAPSTKSQTNSNDSNSNDQNEKSRFGKLLVKGVDGQSVLEVDAQGNLTASGSASFNKLNIATDASASAVIVADSALGKIATSSAQIKTNASAGKGEILPGKTEVIIYTDKLTEKSLVYITPTSDTQNQVLYVKEKRINQDKNADWRGYFKVAINKPVKEKIKFNWWIIN
jgi:hypothetical protein